MESRLSMQTLEFVFPHISHEASQMVDRFCSFQLASSTSKLDIVHCTMHILYEFTDTAQINHSMSQLSGNCDKDWNLNFSWGQSLHIITKLWPQNKGKAIGEPSNWADNLHQCPITKWVEKKMQRNNCAQFDHSFGCCYCNAFVQVLKRVKLKCLTVTRQ